MIKVKPIGTVVYIQFPDDVEFDRWGEIVDDMCEELGLGFFDESPDSSGMLVTFSECDEDSPGKIAFDCERFLRKHLLEED